jgi:hypothetical protein
MSVSDECKTIADAIGCVFFAGTIEELNLDIEKVGITKDDWVFGLVLPRLVTDSANDDNPMVETTYPLSAFVCRQSDKDTQSIDHRTRDMQPIYDAALVLARKFVHKFTELEAVSNQPKKIVYPIIDSHQLGQEYGLDLHLFGVGIQCEFVISEGITGCEL